MLAGQALTLYRLLVAAGKSEMDATAVVTLYPQGGAPIEIQIHRWPQ